MGLDQPLDDGEAEPGAARRTRARRVDAVEPFKYPLLVFGGDPKPVVRDGDDHLWPLTSRFDADGPGCVRERIADDVAEHLPEREFGQDLRYLR